MGSLPLTLSGDFVAWKDAFSLLGVPSSSDSVNEDVLLLVLVGVEELEEA